jgi:hypothetical protein
LLAPLVVPRVAQGFDQPQRHRLAEREVRRSAIGARRARIIALDRERVADEHMGVRSSGRRGLELPRPLQGLRAEAAAEQRPDQHDLRRGRVGPGRRVPPQGGQLAVPHGIVERRRRGRARKGRPAEITRRRRLVAEAGMGLADDAQRIGIGVGPVRERPQGADRRPGVPTLELGGAEQAPGLEVSRAGP